MDENQQQEKKESKISDTAAALMIATAIILDIISIIPVVGQAFADVGSFVIFLIWFLILGLPLVTPKKLLTMLSAYIIELVPAISALPAITVGVILMIALTRAEEKTGIQLLSKKGVPNLGNLTKAAGTVQSVTKGVVDRIPESIKNADWGSRSAGEYAKREARPHMTDMYPSPSEI